MTSSRPSQVGDVFTGRRSEISDLRAALEEARQGRGRLIMLVGEPGIGKTRTAQELARYADEQRVEVLWGRCHEGQGSPPYWPWVQAVRSHARDHTVEELRAVLGDEGPAIAEIMPWLRARLPDLPDPPNLGDPEQARFRLFDSMTTFLVRLAEARPLLVVLDNLHWADASSLLLLEFLAHEVGHSNILLVGTYRDMELSRQHPLSDTLGELTRENLLQRVQLKGLTEGEVDEFLEAASHGRTLPGLASAVHRQTEGNPLFLTEIARFLVQEGWLGIDGPFPVGSAIPIPEGIREVLGKRLNRLSPAGNRVLGVASAIGREFGAAELTALLEDMTADAVAEALEEAAHAWIVEEAPANPGRFQFTHALVHETLYDELSTAERFLLHRRTAETLESLYAANIGPHLERIAYHYLEAVPAGVAGKAVEYAERAAVQANGMLAYEGAARYFSSAIQALDLVEPQPGRRRCELLLALGDSHARRGDYDHAMQAFGRAAGAARGLGWAEGFAEAAVRFEDASWRPGLPGHFAVGLLEEALGLLGQADSAMRARCMVSLARALHFSGSFQRTRTLGQEAVAMARRLSDPATLSWVLRVNMRDQFRPEVETIEERLAWEREIIQLAGKFSDTRMEAYSWSILDHLASGDLATMLRMLDEYERTAAELRQPFFSFVAASCRAMLAVGEGRFDDAERSIDQAHRIGRMRGQDFMGVLGMQMFTLRREQGRLQELEPAVRMFLAQNENESIWRPGLAVLYLELGMIDQAREEYERLAVRDFTDLPRDGVWLACMTYFAEMSAAFGDRKRSEVLYEELLPYAPFTLAMGGCVANYGAASRYLGILATTMERWDAAERNLEHALELNRKIKAWAWVAHTEFRFGEMLLARRRNEDQRRAEGLLRSALRTAQAFGMRTLEARATEKLEAIGDQSRASSHPFGLSAREMEVLRLLALGKSNHEIADSLTITTNTVANHVKSILNKTGASNRTEAAARAVQANML